MYRRYHRTATTITSGETETRYDSYATGVAPRHGRKIAIVAAARRRLELVYRALRNRHVRALAPPKTAPATAAA